ncbi:hypothetical protein [Wolbachia endosymbiont (group B) of Ablattaria laevigata]|uniref:hypothetical protein n=1 Tax=Wolbachia endosymbiont (group B) of Ablattaria laevigata TaxID=3077915 RepID=UPI00376F2438
MPLTEKQKESFQQLYQRFRDNGDIRDIVELLGTVSKEDFLTIFSETNEKTQESIIGTYEATRVDYLKEVLKRAKELVLLKEVVRAKILSSKNQNKVKSISLIKYITDPSRQYPSEVLNNILEDFKEEFFASLSEDELKKIKVAIEREFTNEQCVQQKENLEKLITSIRDLIENRVKAESSTDKINPNVENKLFSPTSKAIVAGAICSVIAGLAVGGGLFAAGVALQMLTLIGIAVAAAVLTGLVAGGITYAVSTKIENPDTSRSATEQDLPQQS